MSDTWTVEPPIKVTAEDMRRDAERDRLQAELTESREGHDSCKTTSDRLREMLATAEREARSDRDRLQAQVAQMREALVLWLRAETEFEPQSLTMQREARKNRIAKTESALQSTGSDYHNPQDVQRIADLTDALTPLAACLLPDGDKDRPNSEKVECYLPVGDIRRARALAARCETCAKQAQRGEDYHCPAWCQGPDWVCWRQRK